MKPCLKTKMLLKKLRKADGLELRSGVMDSKLEEGHRKRKLNLSTCQNRSWGTTRAKTDVLV